MTEILSERISQLDSLYSVVRDLRMKSLILSQMITIAKEIDSEMIKEIFSDPISFRHKKLEVEIRDPSQFIRLIVSYSHNATGYYFNLSESPRELWDVSEFMGKLVLIMDRVRAKLISEMVDRGYLRVMKELPLGLILRGGGREHELSLE